MIRTPADMSHPRPHGPDDRADTGTADHGHAHEYHHTVAEAVSAA